MKCTFKEYLEAAPLLRMLRCASNHPSNLMKTMFMDVIDASLLTHPDFKWTKEESAALDKDPGKQRSAVPILMAGGLV